MYRQLLALLIAAMSFNAAAAVPNLDVRTLRSVKAGVPMISILVLNRDTTSLDSFALRVFVNARDTNGTHSRAGSIVPAPFPTTVGLQHEGCWVEEVMGHQGLCSDGHHNLSESAYAALWDAQTLLVPHPVGPADANGIRTWAFDIPLGALRLRIGEALILELLLYDRTEDDQRLSLSEFQDLAAVAPSLPGQVIPATGEEGWWSLQDKAKKVPSLAASWSFSGTDSVASLGTLGAVWKSSTNPRVLVRRLEKDLWGTSPDGSGPGLPIAAPTFDSGATLPYAAIASPALPKAGRAPLDSAFVRMDRVRVNQAGYRLSDIAAGRAKIRYFGSESRFRVVPANAGGVADSGVLCPLGFTVTASTRVEAYSNSMTKEYALSSDSTKTSLSAAPAQEGTLPVTLPVGRYRVVVGTDTSAPFQVSDSLYGWLRDASVRFLGAQRSGDSSWFHGPAHMDDGALAGAPGAYRGGWYDAGTYLKEPQSMASTLVQLAALAATMPSADADHWGTIHSGTMPRDGVPDILKEARHGADFFLASWQRNGSRTETDSVAHTGMVTGIGDSRLETSWWGRPEMAPNIIGSASRTVRSELGANNMGDVAASLALLSRLWRSRDAVWADTALAAAKEMYAWAKGHPGRIIVGGSYTGPVYTAEANLALASIALLWATHDTVYLHDLAYDKVLGTHGCAALYPNFSFEGGWLAAGSYNLIRMIQSISNSAWRHAVALHAFARLVLLDKDSALALGVRDEAERELLLTRTLAGMQMNLSLAAGGAAGFAFPVLQEHLLNGRFVGSDTAWGLLGTERYLGMNVNCASNAAELLRYADIAAAVRKGRGGAQLAAKTWPVEEATAMALRQLDYILGVNPWGVSFVAGIGTKTLNHPHLPAANPDGSNTPVLSYAYTVPSGALYAGASPSTTELLDSWQNVFPQPNLDGVVQLLTAATLLAPQDSSNLHPVSIGGGAVRAGARLSVIAQAHRIEARLSGLDANAAVRAELLDIRGRVLASAAKTAGADGTAALEVSSTGHGLAILRVRSAGFEHSRSVVLP